MVTRLSNTDKQYLADLAKNFDKRVAEFKKEKQEQLIKGKKQELIHELGELEQYVQGTVDGEIQDVFDNVRFNYAKVDVLREVLGLPRKEFKKKHDRSVHTYTKSTK